VEEAQHLGAETLVIPRRQFNHGSTREAARRVLGTDVVVMVTPDAYARDENVLEQLVAPILARRASVAYARQVAPQDGTIFETALRRFNYPAESHVRGIEDSERFGSYMVFCSNAFAAYRSSALDEIGGFTTVLTNEDALAVAALLRRGHRIAYVAEAVVQHSHRYTLRDEFRRHWDAGYARRQHRAALAFSGRDELRGRRYARMLLATLAHERPTQLPYGIAHLTAKWLGYRIGSASQSVPLALKRSLSGQDYYWRSEDFLSGRSEPAAR
jgi:rhamnosyltransferase